MELRFSKEKELLKARNHRELNEQRADALREGAILAKAHIIRGIVDDREDSMDECPGRERGTKRPHAIKERTRESTFI